MKNRTGKPVRGDDFFDRERELAEIWHLLERDNLLLLAPRRTGKTSLMNEMVDRPISGARCFFVDVESVDSEAQFAARILRKLYSEEPEGAWWARLSDGVRDVLSRVGKVAAGPVEVDLSRALESDWRESATTILTLLRGLDGHKVLLIDEFPRFVQRLLMKEGGPQRTQLLLDWFRELRISRELEEAKVHFLLAGSIGLDAVVSRSNLSGSINDLEVFHLGPLVAGQDRQLIDALCRGEALELPEAVRQRICEAIDWPVPYHLQLVFSEVLRAVKFRAMDPSPRLVDDCVEALTGPERRKNFAHWEERLRDPLATKPERDWIAEILRAAARDPEGITREHAAELKHRHAPALELDVDALLLSLHHDGYLVLDGARWRFGSSLLRRWWLRWKVDA